MIRRILVLGGVSLCVLATLLWKLQIVRAQGSTNFINRSTFNRSTSNGSAFLANETTNHYAATPRRSPSSQRAGEFTDSALATGDNAIPDS